jgi:hypothetical protein
VKLSHLKNPTCPRDKYRDGPVQEDQKYYGLSQEPPTPGKSYYLYKTDGDIYLITTGVKAVYSPANVTEGADKLVLPSNFPEPERLDIPELLSTDILFATLNSLYLLRKL